MNRSNYIKHNPPEDKKILKSPMKSGIPRIRVPKSTDQPRKSSLTNTNRSPNSIIQGKTLLRPSRLDPRRYEAFKPSSEQQLDATKKRKTNELSPNAQMKEVQQPLRKRMTYVESSMEDSTDSLPLSKDEMNQMWDNLSEKEKEMFKKLSGSEKISVSNDQSAGRAKISNQKVNKTSARVNEEGKPLNNSCLPINNRGRL